MKKLIILSILVTAGCATSSDLKVTNIGSDGKKFLIRCNTPEACYEKANSLCQKGYSTVSSNMVNPDGWAGKDFKQTLIEVECK